MYLAHSTNSNAATFLRLINNDFEKLKIKTCKNKNLDAQEIKAHEQLSSNDQITIKPADKGGNIVILDNEDYTTMCNKILKNQEWYRRA